jgi:hypothetical protein
MGKYDTGQVKSAIPWQRTAEIWRSPGSQRNSGHAATVVAMYRPESEFGTSQYCYFKV